MFRPTKKSSLYGIFFIQKQYEINLIKYFVVYVLLTFAKVLSKALEAFYIKASRSRKYL